MIKTTSKVKMPEKIETEILIHQVKDFFKTELSKRLNLFPVSAPLTVVAGTGINDDLNGVEKPVTFFAKSLPDRRIEIVQSLAKWKRLKLAELEIDEDYGIITDMKALRPDEIISPIHSIYVDQWDWEKRVSKKDRTLDYLKKTVSEIYDSIKEAEKHCCKLIPELKPILPEKISFIHSEELQYRYPKLTPKQRESVVAKDLGAVFIIGIGHQLADGVPHDLRAPDYDDWSTINDAGYKGLNGDIIVWNPILESAFEISSMGIRVDSAALLKQLKITRTEERVHLSFHKKILNSEIPLSIGGGIGQSRLLMFLLRKNHISKVQSSLWP